MLAWLPENIIYGKPKIIDILITSEASVAKARDAHYHNPPNYVVLEPENTTGRTKNLQQTNTNGYKFQNEKGSIQDAEIFVNSWGEHGRTYNTSPEYQEQLRTLLRKYDYRFWIQILQKWIEFAMMKLKDSKHEFTTPFIKE